MKTVLVAVLLLINASALADPAAVAKQTRAWRADHEGQILAEFADLLAIPNLANDAPNIQRNADAIRAMCEKRGLTTKLLTMAGAPPVVVANFSVPEAKRTIAFYAHYDGQPVDASQWKSPPWQPVMRDQAGTDVDWRDAKSIDPESRLFARSAADDKAPIMAMLAALDALKAAGVKPSVNLRFVFEGEEEAGSPHLADYLKRFRDELPPTPGSFAMAPSIKAAGWNWSSAPAGRSASSLPFTARSRVCTTATTATGCRTLLFASLISLIRCGTRPATS